MKDTGPYELLVIGGGSAGHAAARKAGLLGLRAALVEAAPELGGLCILRGCMPSKTLIETANRMRIMRDGARFGIGAQVPVLDPERLRARLESLLDDFRRDRVTSMESGCYELLRGSARFSSPHEIELTAADGTVTPQRADAFVIATGSHPTVPPIAGLDGTPFWTSDDVVRLPSVPKRIAILGAGAIGMEFAHLFEGFGSEVTVIAHGESIMGGGTDPDIAIAMEAESRERGIRFLKKTEVKEVAHGEGLFRLRLRGEAEALEAEALLVATGRKPTTAGLELEKIGIAMEEGRILIDERATTSRPHIFAAGDCASPVPVVHLAVIQGKVAARNAARLIRKDHLAEGAEWNRHSAMSAWFTEPQCVRIGLSETQAKEEQIPVLVGRQSYADHGKGMISGARHGFVKVLADPESGRLLGAAGLGPEVVETAHLLQMAIELRMSAADYLAIPHYHPTLAEAWLRAVEAIEAQR
ncbi:NAD(P)/FAD-dependent oxidoreductase [Haloferula sp. BvORR071]|uniref:dihydrolipoyl dehydrogenase family protein n=1 Tax=Haloferula sp. BvORR071 TaxID=1396141 RepID=UPI00069861C4|nr:NAD(P)/FAD-dependent oxidoreductase [Haloferula sp. BvORR071]